MIQFKLMHYHVAKHLSEMTVNDYNFGRLESLRLLFSRDGKVISAYESTYDNRVSLKPDFS